MFFLVYLSLLNTVACSCIGDVENIGVVGGEDIDIKEAPHQISLQIGDSHACGGSIVDKDIIVTAAHCLILSNTANMSIRAGSTFHDEGGVIHAVSKILWNPEFGFKTLDYDVGVIRLVEPLTFSDVVKPIEMADVDEEMPDGGQCATTGWGRLGKPTWIMPKILQRVMIPKVNDEVCRNAYKDIGNVTKRMVCAGVPEGGLSSCYGDSGGPLVYNTKLCGIVSWGKRCGLPGFPSVFSKVSALREWIDEAIAKLKAEDF